jgi:hypothetical protein
MAEANQYVFTYKEVVESLIKHQGLHDGVWSLLIKFGIGAANLGPSDDALIPTAMVPVLELGLMKGTKENNLAVDAAKVNPAQSKAPPPARRDSGVLTGTGGTPIVEAPAPQAKKKGKTAKAATKPERRIVV